MRTALLQRISRGKRVVGYVVTTVKYGNVLVVVKKPKDISITAKYGKWPSINESIADNKAGWAVEEDNLAAIRSFKCTKVVFYTKKPGILYDTDAKNYISAGNYYMAQKSKSGDFIRCVSMEKFNITSYRVKI
jgi:hypothetical protein